MIRYAIGGMILGYLFAWVSFISFTAFYLYKRDEVITQMTEEINQRDYYIEKMNTRRDKHGETQR